MAELPVSAEQFLKDFAFDLVEWTIERNGKEVGTVKALRNSDEGGEYLGMLYGCDVRPGDRLNNPLVYLDVLHIEVDTYNDAPSLLKVYF